MRVFFVSGLAVLLAGCIVNVDVDDDHDRTVRGSGERATVERSFTTFESVSFATEGTLTIEFGDEESIWIEADDNLLDYIETYVRSGTLYIEVEDGIDLVPRQTIRLHLTVRDVESLSLLGSGDIDLGSIDRTHFGIAVLGSGDIRVDHLETSTLSVAIAGSGDLHVAGSTGDLEIAVSGSGSFLGREFESVEASVSILGSGSATLGVSDRLDVSILGSGSVHYYGSPYVHSSILGSGRVVMERR